MQDRLHYYNYIVLAEAVSGATLSIDYVCFTGKYNYYEQEANKGDGTFELELDNVVQGLEYLVATLVEGLIQPADVKITTINDCILEMVGAKRIDTGLLFNWQTTNPGEYNTYVHTGLPPVIGSDGIIYGLYQNPDLHLCRLPHQKTEPGMANRGGGSG